MKKAHNVTFVSILQYTGIMFLSNYIASFISNVVISTLLKPIESKIPYVLLMICALAVYVLVGLLVPLFANFLFFRSVAAKQYVPSEDKFHWLKSFARLVLLSETIRFLVCWKSLGHLNQTGNFAFLPTLLFENTYLLWSNRHYEIRQWLEYNATDFLAYAVCYIIYLVIYLALVMLLYRHFWKKAAMNDSEALSE